LLELTAPSRRSLRSPFDEEGRLRCSSLLAKPLLKRFDLEYAIQAARALAPETFNPLAYSRLLSDPKISRYERIVLSWAKDRVRERVWTCTQKAYLEMGLNWVEQLTGLPDQEVEGWIKSHGGRIEGGKAKMR